VSQIQRPKSVVNTLRRNSQSAFWIIPLTLIFLATVMFGYFYILPSYVNESIAKRDAMDVEPLYQKIDTLKKKNTRLIGELALARRSAEIDGGAAKELLITLSDREKEMRVLREELNFLKSMVSSKESMPGLNIRDFVLRELSKSGRYAFKLVLLQVENDDQAHVIKGSVKIRVQGRLKGKSKTLAWDGGAAPRVSELQFKFQFFQRLEGELLFPEGFEPENILVKAEPSGKSQSPFQKIYSWSSVYQESRSHVGKK